MMEVYRTPSKESQEIILANVANVTYEAVIDGLNGYFASEPRNDYITVKMESDKQNFALYEAEAWADILISWLRTEHEIFYYPGMEAKHAKIERIPPFTERMMDEGALNSLKALHKRVIGQEVGINSHTLIADSIKCAVNAKEREIEKLKERIAELEFNFKAVCDEDDIFRTRALKAEEEVKKHNDQLKKDTDYVADTLCDILEALGISKSNVWHLDIPGLKTKAIQRASLIKVEHDRYQEQLDKATADYQALSEKNQEFKIELNTLRDIVSRVRSRLNKKFCPLGYETDLEKLADIALRAVEARDETINRITKPWHDECEDTKELKEQKDRAAAILQDLYRDIFHKDCTQFTYEDIATKILNRVLETEDLLHKSVDSVNKKCMAVGKLMVADYKLKLKDYILKDIKKRGYRYNGLETKSIEDIVDWIITMATCPRNEWANSEIRNLRGQIDRLKGLINAMNEEVKDM